MACASSKLPTSVRRTIDMLIPYAHWAPAQCSAIRNESRLSDQVTAIELPIDH